MNSIDAAAASAGAPESSVSTWRDWLGIVASIGCAIHCATMPFVIAYLPALGLSFLADEAFHKWMALICFLIAFGAFVPGILKHGSWIPAGVGTVGLVAITFAAFGLAGECCPSCAEQSVATEDVAAISGECEDCKNCEACATAEDDGTGVDGVATGSTTEKDKSLLAMLAPWITPFGGLVLVSAHLLNRRFGYTCSCCDADGTEPAGDEMVQLAGKD